MMKRILACLIAVACLLIAVAMAEEPTMTMKVIKCKQAVNLRRGPGTETDSLGLVPLDTELTGCARVENSDWIAVNYQGIAGYIRSDFLELVAVEELGPVAERSLPVDAPVQNIGQATNYTDDAIILEETVDGVRVMARQIFMDANEYLMVVGLDAIGAEVWKKQTATPDVTEMTQTAAFIGGTAQAPLVMMYNDWLGLSALDPATGEVRWEVTKDDVFLGGSVSWAVDANGTLYIAGYYGPEPVAISADGAVLWQADSGKDANWLYNLELTEDGISCQYESLNGDGGATSGTVVYNYNGTVKEIVYD